MTKKQRYVRYRETVQTTTKLDLLASIEKSLSEFFMSALFRQLSGLKKNFKLNDIEFNGNEVLIVYSSSKKDNSFKTVKPEVTEVKYVDE